MENLKDFEMKRLYLVKHELYRAYTETSKEKVSLYKIINIILLLFQTPIALVLYKKCFIDNEIKFKLVLKTVHDSSIGNKFSDNLNKYHEFSKPYLENDNISEYLHEIPGSSYGMLMFNMHRGEGKNNIAFSIISKKDKENHPRSKESIIFEYLWKLLRSTSYSKMLGLGDHLEKILNSIGVEKKEKKKVSNHYYKAEVPCKEANDIYRNIESVIDKTYKSLYRTPLISVNNKFPPNIFFFYKFFIKSGTHRYGGYKYDTAIILPPSQEGHVREMFSHIKHNKEIFLSKKEEGKWVYPKTIFDDEWVHSSSIVGYEDNENYSYENLMEQFYDILFNQENGIDIIINSIKSNFTDRASSLADPVISTGIMYIRRKPFSDGGDDRIKGFDPSEKINLNDEKNIDILRLISTSYLMTSMAPSSTNESLRMLLMPVRINGSTTFCMGTITSVSNDISLEGQGQGHWDLFFHFFTNTGKKGVGKIRKEMELSYLRELSKIITNSLISNTKENNGKIIISTNRFKKEVNISLVRIAHYYPYDILNFINKKSEDIEDYNKVVLLQNIKIYFDVLLNPFFEKKVMYNFFTTEEIVRILNEAIKNSLYFLSIKHRGNTSD